MAERVATLAGGCFWCIQAVFDDMVGVSAVESGHLSQFTRATRGSGGGDCAARMGPADRHHDRTRRALVSGGRLSSGISRPRRRGESLLPGRGGAQACQIPQELCRAV